MYQSSGESKRYFCSTCGSDMFDVSPKHDLGALSTGVLDQGRDEGILDFRSHIFVGSTGDGGFADWLPSVAGKEMTRWEGYPDSTILPPGWRDSTMPEFPSDPAQSGADKVHAFCHCKGVEFFITRPDANTKGEGDWWMDREKGRWSGATCSCGNCARATGNDLNPMIFVHRDHVVGADGKPVPMPFGTMKIFESSKDVERSFCATCGAMIFYYCKERPWLVDVGPGLLDTPDARAGDWVSYMDQWISWGDKAFNPGLARDLRKGLIEFDKAHPGVMRKTGRTPWIPAEEKEATK